MLNERSAAVAEIAARYGYDMERTDQRRAAAEEYLADLAETHEDMGLLRRIYAEIRRMLRAMGIKVRLRDADIDYILTSARRTAREGVGRPAARMQRAYGIGRSPAAGAEAIRFAVSHLARGNEVAFSAGDALFTWLGVAPGAIWADAVNLQRKHPEMFATPDEVIAHIAYVLEGADYAMPATKPDYTLLVARRDTGLHRAATVEFVRRGGKYRVRNAQFMPERQLEVKLEKARARGDEVKVGPAVAGRSSAVPGSNASAVPQEPSPPSGGRPAGPDDSIVPDPTGRDPDARFSLAAPADSGGSPLGGGRALLDSIRDVIENTGQWSRDRWQQALPVTLGALTLRQLADIGKAHVPGIAGYTAEQQRMDTRRNEMVDESGVFASDQWERWARKRENRQQEAAAVMHHSRQALPALAGCSPINPSSRIQRAWRSSAKPSSTAMRRRGRYAPGCRASWHSRARIRVCRSEALRGRAGLRSPRGGSSFSAALQCLVSSPAAACR